ncbi:MAG: sugar phosphate isomerase/epimerase [Oscillospiraceae bacterium]|nr:sugar phosphate isomerase/epimerase [Oscillospiraceae bacterium]
MNSFIKRGVTIYSFRDLVRSGQFTWGECIGEMANLGITGMEMLGQLFFRNCPDINPEDLAKWNELMWTYGAKTVAHDFFVDKYMFKGRSLTLRESLEVLERHIKFAAGINCPIIRIGGTFDPELFRLAAPICEDNNVKLGVEIHNGSSTFDLPEIQKTIEIIRQSGSKYIGIIPDMSLFVQDVSSPNSYFMRGAIMNGASQSMIDEVCKIYREESGGNRAAFEAHMTKFMEGLTNPAEKMLAFQVRRSENHDPKELIEHLPYIFHVHGKFWEMNEDCVEPSIGDKYPQVMKILADGGYKGYISAEYEGGPIPGDPFLPFKRYSKMLDNALGTYPSYEEPVQKPIGEWGKSVSSRGYKNIKDAEGNITGFEIYAKSSYYRGVPLCLVDSCSVEVDGEKFDESVISFRVDGQEFKFEEMANVQSFYWNYDYEVSVIVKKPGGLDPSVPHNFVYDHKIRTYYLPFYWGDHVEITLNAIDE